MGLFSKVFGKDKSPTTNAKKEEGAEKVRWFTNAPAHWPVFVTEQLPHSTPQDTQQEAINQLMFMANLSNAFKESNCGCELSAVAQSRLTPQGILSVPIEVMEKDKKFSVFIYPASSKENAGHYHGAARLLEERGEPTPVYYAPSPLDVVPPLSPVRPFSSVDLSKAEGAPKGQYAMWWPSEKDTSFVQSNSFSLIKRTYENLNGINTYVFADILRHLELVKEDVGRAALPDDGMSVPLQGPENCIMLFSASREKGIRFHFHTESTPVAYRDNFWSLFAEYTQSVKAVIEEHKHSKDPEDPNYERGPLGWWTMVELLLTKEKPEEGDKVQLFGAIEVAAD